MARCTVKDWQGQEVGSADLNLAVARPESAAHVLYLALRRQLHNARQGNAHTKTRSEVRGGGRKPWKQKGTGRARAGSIRSPLWPKGGVIFGPRKREFHLNMNRKERQLALRTALQDRVEDLVVVEDFTEHLIQNPKTREVVRALQRWGVKLEQSALVIVASEHELVRRAIRNIERVKLITTAHLNVFDLLHADRIVVTQPALDQIKQRFGDTSASAPSSDGSDQAAIASDIPASEQAIQVPAAIEAPEAIEPAAEIGNSTPIKTPEASVTVETPEAVATPAPIETSEATETSPPIEAPEAEPEAAIEPGDLAQDQAADQDHVEDQATPILETEETEASAIAVESEVEAPGGIEAAELAQPTSDEPISATSSEPSSSTDEPDGAEGSQASLTEAPEDSAVPPADQEGETP